MLGKIQKKPLPDRKKARTIILIIVGICLIPIWLFGFKKTLDREKDEETKDSEYFKEMRDIAEDLKIAAEDLKDAFKELSNKEEDGLEAELPISLQRVNGSSTEPNIIQ